MNTDKLSKRLAMVASLIPYGSKIADIGSDHAYLPCYTVKKGTVPFAIAGEVAEGPFLSALKQVKTEGLTDKIQVRKGNGLEVIQPGEVETITIAGMGGTLISQILEAGKEKLVSVQKLILQPNVGAFAVRNWLLENGWELVQEEILEEDGKIYEILSAIKGDPASPYQENPEKEILFGPYLLKQKNTAFLKKWESELKNWQRILSKLDKAEESESTLLKKAELIKKISMAKEVLGK